MRLIFCYAYGGGTSRGMTGGGGAHCRRCLSVRVYACARRTYRNLVRHGGIPSRCLKIASVDCWLRPFLVPPGIRNACGRTALGGERSESGPSALGIGRGVGTRVVAATLAVSERLPIRK